MIACIDISGTAIKVALANENGKLIRQSKISVNDTFDGFIDDIVEWVEQEKKVYKIEGIAFSSPGAVDCKSGIVNGASAIPYIHGPCFKDIIKERLHLPCSIENDANCAALAEVYCGVAKDYQDVCFVVIGSGIGGAVIKDGVIHHGQHFHGGEFGYMVVVDGDGECQPILSELASTEALVRRVEKRIPGLWNGKKVFEEASKGNEVCKEEIETFYKYLTVCIYNIQYIYDPELIVIGGAVSKREDLCNHINRHMDMLLDKVKIAKVRPKVVCCQYHGDANLIGAFVNYQYEYNRED